MRRTSAEPGFAPPIERPLGRERRGIALAELMATLGLTLAMIVAIGVIGVGIARADVLGVIERHDGSVLRIAVVSALVVAGVGGLTAASFSRGLRRHTRE
jgi:hypothetical protein